MTRYKQHTDGEGEDGWTDWIQPHHAKYKMRCCDCDLVHVMQLRVVRDGDDPRTCDIEDEVPGLVVFRVRRDQRATAASRRKRKK